MMGLRGTPFMTNPKQRRYSPEQIIWKLAEGNKLLAGGMTIEEVCRQFGIAELAWHRWLSR